MYACAVPSIEQQQKRRLVRLVVALTEPSGNRKAFLIHDPLRIDIGTHIHHKLLATGGQPDITETSAL